MFKKAALIIFLMCSGLFFFSNSDCFAQAKQGTFLGYAYLQAEGSIEHAVMTNLPGSMKQVLYLGTVSELGADLAECFQSSLEYEFEMVVTGSVGTYADGTRYLLLDRDVKCSLRN